MSEQLAQRGSPPSTYAVLDFVEGRPGATLRLLGLTAMRSLFVAPGLYLAGVRRPAQLAGYSLAASVSISVCLVAYYGLRGPRP